MLCIECFSGLSAEWVMAIASVISLLVAGISVYLFNKSLTLLIKQNAATDVPVYKERYDAIENYYNNYSYNQLKADAEFRRVMRVSFDKNSYGLSKDENGFNEYLERIFHISGGLTYFGTFQRICMAFYVHPVNLAIRRNKLENLDDYEIDTYEMAVKIVDSFFLSYWVNRKKVEIKEYLTDLLSSDISPAHKIQLFRKVKNNILGDYLEILNDKNEKIKYDSKYFYDLLYVKDGKVISLFNERKYDDLAKFIYEIEPKFLALKNP